MIQGVLWFSVVSIFVFLNRINQVERRNVCSWLTESTFSAIFNDHFDKSFSVNSFSVVFFFFS